jgi:hypothetical protein
MSTTTAPQAEKLAEPFERSQSQGFEKFAELLDRRFSELEARLSAFESRIDAKFAGVDARFEGLRAEFYKALHDNLMKTFGFVVAEVSLAVAIIKLFTDWH